MIDAVLLPPPSPAPPASPAPAPESSGDIVDLATSNPDFETLATVLGLADLVGALQGDGPFTVFAPVNDAFAAIPSKFLEEQWRGHLTEILKYHVFPGLILSSDLEVGADVTSLEGGDLIVTSLTPPTINDAVILEADVRASNGVIHAIDSVLLPSFLSTTIVDAAVADPQTFSTLVDLVLEAGLADDLSSDGPFTVFAPTNAGEFRRDSLTTFLKSQISHLDERLLSPFLQ